jgi:hypothetical protein
LTARAIIIGLLGAILIGAGGRYAADHIPGMRAPVSGHLPVVVYGLLIFFCGGINLLLGRIRKGWRFRAGETALMMALMLAGCAIPTAGLMRYFPRSAIQPIINTMKEPVWQQSGLLKETPSVLLANGGEYSEEVVGDYLAPMGEPGRPISITRVPWHAWKTPLTVWGGIIILTLLGVVGLSVLVHRSWASQERLRYPLAVIATSLLEEDDSGRIRIFASKGFWCAAGVVFVIRMFAGLHHYFNDFIYLPLTFDLSALKTAFPKFMAIPGADALTSPTIYPICTGLTFLLAADIGLSLGICHLVGLFLLYFLLIVGVDISGGAMTGSVLQWQSFGSFLAMGVMLIYIGRRHYWRNLVEAVTFVRQPETDAAGVWGCRTFLVSTIGVVSILSLVGMAWPVAVVTVGVMLLTFVVCARMAAECGTFFFAPAWVGPGVVAGLFGAMTLGPGNMIIMGLVLLILTIDPFECLMPFAANGLKVASDAGLKPGKVGLVMGFAIVLAIAVAVPTALWSDYNLTPDLRHGWDTHVVYSSAQVVSQSLALSGTLEGVKRYSSWDHLVHMRPEPGFITAAGLGFLLLVGCSLARLRLPWWPIHPVLFLGLGSWTMGKFACSFFLGWLLRAGITRFGGASTYMKARPAVIGVILGDLAGGFVLMIVGWLYYSITGTSGSSAMLW